jgi:hypothetical protein
MAMGHIDLTPFNNGATKAASDCLRLLAAFLRNVSDVFQALKTTVLSPAHGGVFLSCREDYAICQRELMEHSKFGRLHS